MAMILHITTRADWDAARAAGSYRPTSLAHDKRLERRFSLCG